MRPINLLPQKHRPHSASGERSGSAYLVVGVLTLVLVAVTAYVLTSNQISSRTADVAQARTEADQTKAKAEALGSFGNFASVKNQRLAAVRTLAGSRFDWERLTREVSRVLPEGVSLTSFDASLTGEGAKASSAAGEVAKPTMTLAGCARNQRDVANTLLRLRRLHRTEDVGLTDSTRSDEAASAAAPGAGSAPAGCGSKQKVLFNAKVTFNLAPAVAAEPGSREDKVPASLGGGS